MGEWQSLTLKHAGVQLLDCVHKTPPAKDFGAPYVGIPQMKNGEIDLSTAREISREDFAEWTRKVNPQQFDCVFRSNPATIPTGKRPPFRRESGRHSDSIPSTFRSNPASVM